MNHCLLIEKTASAESTQWSLDAQTSINAAFYIPDCRKLKLNTAGWSKDAADYLMHAIARSPNNLHHHVQRINLYILKQDKEHLYGALLDLFIVLANHGMPLRERMLKAAQPLLHDHDYQSLQKHLEAGLTAKDVVTQHKNSILSNGISSPHQLITRCREQDDSFQDPVVEARDHLQYGQIDAAREVLEVSIKSEPERMELYLELLDIYQYTNDGERYQKMQQQLESCNSPILIQWLAQSDSFEENS